MSESSADLDARTRKTHSLLLRALASKGQRATAEAVGISETAISRMKSDGEIERMARFLTFLEFKPVPLTAKCVTAERAAEIEAEFADLRRWATRGVQRADPPNFDEPDTGLHFT